MSAAATWRPEIPGWSDDILLYYHLVAGELPDGAIIAEVGVNAGRSAVYLAERLLALGKRRVHFYAIDWWPGEGFRRELLATYRAGLASDEAIDLLRVVRCDGVRAASLFLHESLDFVFIDSDHSEPGMVEHLRVWTPKVKPGGILAGHDYSEVDWPGVVRAVDAHFGRERIGRPTSTVWEYRKPGVPR